MDPNNPYQPNNTPAPQPQQTPPPEQPGYTAPVPPTPEYQQPTPQPIDQTQIPPAGQFNPQQNFGGSQIPAPNQTPPPRDVFSQGTPTPPPRPKSYNKLPLPIRIMEWLKGHWWAPIVTILGIILVADIIYQFTIPMSAIPPGTVVDGISIGGMTRDDAAKKLDEKYNKLKVDIFFGDSTIPYKTPTAAQVGIFVHNSSRLQNVSYPLYLRFIPSSSFWAKELNTVGTIVYDYDKSTIDTYTLNEVGEECYIKPKNASLKIDDGRFAVIPAIPGGKCDINELKDEINQATIGKEGKYTIRTGISEELAPITDEIARQLGDELNHTTSKELLLQAGGKTYKVPPITVKGWLSFKAIIPEKDKNGKTTLPARLAYVIEPERVQKYLDNSGISATIEKEPGVTKISTTDFKVTSQTKGNPGTLIDIKKTIANIDRFVMGRLSKAEVVTGPVPATVKYDRTYTPTKAGYMALIRQFGEDHGEHFGIKFQEISGGDPLLGGTYRVDEPFPAAGVEGLYLAYAAQAGIEDGTIQPTDRIEGSRTVTDCMEAAVASQDKDCIDALLTKISNATVERRMREIGLNHTSFSTKTITTTAGDLYKFIYGIEEKLLKIEDYGELERPMRDIDMRDGFLKVATSSSITTIGGENGGYNEAANVSDDGKYILVMLSNQENADLARELMKAVMEIRIQKDELD